MTPSIDQVGDLIAGIAAEKILPRFRQLSDDDIEDKGGGDPVTIADIEAEQTLTPHLRDLLPGSNVIGEEAVHETPALLHHLSGDEPVWIIDPVDGTRNFTQGSGNFVVIVALVRHRETVAGWIYQPTEHLMTTAEKGSGAVDNGQPLKTTPVSAIPDMTAAIHTGNIVKEQRPALDAQAKKFKKNAPLYCAGMVYQQLARGVLDCAFFGRTKPWDHAAGALILEEAGGLTAFTNDNSRYQPDHGDRLGLLAAGSHEAWQTVRRDIIGDLVF